MAIEDTFQLLVNDGIKTETVTFAQLKDGAVLNDTDKFLVNDGTKTDAQALPGDKLRVRSRHRRRPLRLSAVVLGQDGPVDGSRFTGKSFTSECLPLAATQPRLR